MKNNYFKRLTQQERLNFLLTNRIPRRLATQLMGWLSRIQSPMLTRITLKIWRLFADDLNLDEAKKSRFTSLHECFIRELKPGARPIDQNSEVLVSPCDAIVGAHGDIQEDVVFQAKGFPYTLFDLLQDEKLVETYRNGVYLTLRLKSTMYHRFHAPRDCNVKKVTYISGDTWNVNPIALKRVEKLYCKNERAVLSLDLNDTKKSLTLVPIAAILVASIKLKFLYQTLNLKYKGPNHIYCNAAFAKGDEMGYFQHGSTIVVFAEKGFTIVSGIEQGQSIKMGEALLHMPQSSTLSGDIYQKASLI